ncbi:MAG: hypothetical protein KAU20_00960 [Nanoarchaeota archaeon]|nr:hypothetical protein [Nanoarchaeota archaeon]
MTIPNWVLNLGKIIAVLCLVEFVRSAYNCVEISTRGVCYLNTKTFLFIPNSPMKTTIIGLMGVIILMTTLYYDWSPESRTNKLKKYFFYAFFFLVSIFIIKEYIIPIIYLSFENLAFKPFKWAIFLVGMAVMILFWDLKESCIRP